MIYIIKQSKLYHAFINLQTIVVMNHFSFYCSACWLDCAVLTSVGTIVSTFLSNNAQLALDVESLRNTQSSPVTLIECPLPAAICIVILPCSSTLTRAGISVSEPTSLVPLTQVNTEPSAVVHMCGLHQLRRAPLVPAAL